MIGPRERVRNWSQGGVDVAGELAGAVALAGGGAVESPASGAAAGVSKTAGVGDDKLAGSRGLGQAGISLVLPRHIQVSM